MTRLRLGLLAVCLGAASCVGSPARTYTRKLVVLGFDGMDPALVRRWMGEGKLPNMKKLAAAGGVYPLATTPSPEAASAWASFATGANPGRHGLYDFLVRDAAASRPRLGMVRREPGRFLFDYVPVAPPTTVSLRAGTSFWVTAGRAGVRSSVLAVPMTFPPEPVPNGHLLSGLPLPDLRGTLGTFAYYATDLDRSEEGRSEFGGVLARLVFDDGVARAELVGPPNPIVEQELARLRAKAPPDAGDRSRIAALEAREDLRLPLVVHWNRAGRRATIDVGDRPVHLQEGEWSKWIDLDFDANLLVRRHGMAQLYLAAADKALRLYVSPLNWRPDRPPEPMSSPASFAGDLYVRLGPYRTLGWGAATWPLNENRIDERAFMDDLYRALDDRMQIILQRLDTRQWDLLVGVVDATDRVQHMMWRLRDPKHPMYDRDLAGKFGDAIENVYRRCDEFVGEIVSRLEPGTAVLIVSDHGFHSFRRAVNLNTWLIEQGFMAPAGESPAPRVLSPPLPALPARGVDWSRTRAYAMGLGQLYLNLKGRERQGIVLPGAEERAVEDDLSARLLALVDPETGARMVGAVYKASDVYAGPYLADAPDLQVGFADGYRVSWQTVLGGAPPRLVGPNLEKWSGDHNGFDYAATAGVLIANRRLKASEPRIVDIAPTVLRYFDVTIPIDIDGTPLF